MKKKNTIYVCSECGEEFSKWSGMCENCKNWNTLKEFKVDSFKTNSNKKAQVSEISNLGKIKKTNFSRLKSNIYEFDRVLGGGIVPGSVILLGGDPGIGKSTLTAQVISNIKDALYISGEESLEQIKLRVDRLNIKNKDLSVVCETDIDSIIKTITKNNSSLVIIDSIQTMYSESFPSTPGSMVQVRECGLRLQNIAKKLKIPIIMIGHVTKSGNVAGPKILEHLVDVVLYLEGERYHNNRILRAQKNRFGSIDEIGVFEMEERGMVEVKNPSKLFLEEKNKDISGSVVAVTVEGNRPILVEVQALVSKTNFGYPKRTTSGFDLNRLNLIIAILSQRGRVNLGNYDVYINIVGGLKVKDPGIDLAIAIAIVSAYVKKSVANNYAFFGELGLSGEIRKVKFDKKRTNEAKRLGFKKINHDKYLGILISKLFKRGK